MYVSYNCDKKNSFLKTKYVSINMTYSLQPTAYSLSLGILGSGQLGQMIAMAAKKMGHRVLVYDVLRGGPAASVADEMIVAPFDDEKALRDFASRVDLITLEFENIPAASLELLASLRPLHPSPHVVRICQDRVLEKEFLQKHGFPVAPFCVITSVEELVAAVRELKTDAILKTATLGYDGKGQVSIAANASVAELQQAWAALHAERAVLEKRINFCAEGSVIVARSTSGEISSFPPQENSHARGILDVSRAPARFSEKVLREAEALGRSIAEALEVVGLLTIEFFLLPNDEIIVNELAPRPHNSGHHTIESSKTSQFEQIVRAATGASLGSTELVKPALMLNLLGDLWKAGEPDWKTFLGRSEIFLHLYGKKEAKPGRKMGHVTFTGRHREELLQQAKEQLRKEIHSDGSDGRDKKNF